MNYSDSDVPLRRGGRPSVMKTIKHWCSRGKEDQETPPLQRKPIRYTSLRSPQLRAYMNVSEFKRPTHLKTAWIRPSGSLRRSNYWRITRRRRRYLAKKQKEWTLDQCKGCGRDLFPPGMSSRDRKGETMVSTCVVPTVKHGGGGGGGCVMLVTCWWHCWLFIPYSRLIYPPVREHPAAMPSHLVGPSFHAPNTPPGYGRAMCPGRRTREWFVRWPGLHNNLSWSLKWAGVKTR